ncbi:MAG: GTPase ObgE, partial [Bartonella sp.]|nr:GTPase ObgE [Bartonella sp.]
IVALSQIDTLPIGERAVKQEILQRASGKPVMMFSAVSHEGLDRVLRAVAHIIEEERKNNVYEA